SLSAPSTSAQPANPSFVVPSFVCVTPPPTLVPYSRHCLAWKVPSRPVMPWTTTRVFLSAQIDICSLCWDGLKPVLHESLLQVPYVGTGFSLSRPSPREMLRCAQAGVAPTRLHTS